MFRMFEAGTQSKTVKYDTSFWSNVTPRNGDNGEPPQVLDSQRLARMRDQCVAMRKRVDTREKSALNANVPVDSLLIGTEELCANNMYWGIEWTNTKMVNTICTQVASKIRFERMDIRCAFTRLFGSDDITDTILGATRKGNTESSTIRTVLESQKNLVDEIQDSLDTIKSMTYDACASTALTPDTDFTGLNCATHTFRNTKTWSCPQPNVPLQAQWATACKSFNMGDSCTSECSASYFAAPGGSGVTTCIKQQGSMFNVDVTMVWTAPTISCQPCLYCTTSEVTQSVCSKTANTVCACKQGFAGTATTAAKTGTCTACAAGKFADVTGLSACKTCGTGTFITSTGATSCGACRTCTGALTQMTACQPAQDTVCQCAPGYAGPNPSSCTACGSGRFANVAGLTACKVCSTCTGAYIENVGCTATADRQCKCNVGFYGTALCTACPSGKFTAATGQSSCADCRTCNSVYEDRTSLCTTSVDTTCKCKTGALNNQDTCFDVLKRKREQRRSS